jgi:hypothetical protein
MNLVEDLPVLKGRGRFWVYEGDIEWERRSDGILVRRNPLLLDSGWMDNGIATTGKDMLLNRLFATTVVNAMDSTNGNVGVGTDSTAFAAAQTKLNPSVSGTVLLQTMDATFPSRVAEVVTTQSTFGTGVANFSWNECGLFNGPTNGTSTMFDRIVIGPFSKTAAVSIVLQITITQS